MARDEGAGAGAVMLAFLVGAVAGAALALLYAPATGEETRAYLGDKAREGRKKANEVAARGREVIERGREAYHSARGRGIDSVAW